jgi:hypothetical protein
MSRMEYVVAVSGAGAGASSLTGHPAARGAARRGVPTVAAKSEDLTPVESIVILRRAGGVGLSHRLPELPLSRPSAMTPPSSFCVKRAYP